MVLRDSNSLQSSSDSLGISVKEELTQKKRGSGKQEGLGTLAMDRHVGV